LTIDRHTFRPVVVVKIIASNAETFSFHVTSRAASDHVISQSGGSRAVVLDRGAGRGRIEYTVAILGSAHRITSRGLVTVFAHQTTSFTELLAGTTQLRVLNAAHLSAEVGNQVATRSGSKDTISAANTHVGVALGKVRHGGRLVTILASQANTQLSDIGSGTTGGRVSRRKDSTVVLLELTARSVAILINPGARTRIIVVRLCDAGHPARRRQRLVTGLASDLELSAQHTVGGLSLESHTISSGLAVVSDQHTFSLEAPSAVAIGSRSACRRRDTTDVLRNIARSTSERASLIKL
jgi:hypothetical protein